MPARFEIEAAIDATADTTAIERLSVDLRDLAADLDRLGAKTVDVDVRVDVDLAPAEQKLDAFA